MNDTCYYCKKPFGLCSIYRSKTNKNLRFCSLDCAVAYCKKHNWDLFDIKNKNGKDGIFRKCCLCGNNINYDFLLWSEGRRNKKTEKWELRSYEFYRRIQRTGFCCQKCEDEYKTIYG